MNTPEKPVSVLQTAKTVGRSHTAIANAVADGRLVRSVVRSKSGKAKILLSLFQAEWEAFTDRGASADGRRGGRPTTKAKPASASPPVTRLAPAQVFREELPDHTPPDGEGFLFDESGQAVMGFQASRVKAAHIDALQKELKFNQLSGKPVEVEKVQAAADRVARQLRNLLLSIPDRVSSRLAAEKESHKVHRILLDELHKALTSLPVAATVDAG